MTKDFKFLWKLKLGQAPAKSASFSEPLLYPGLITGKGFKDLALLADAGTLYAVDSELGEMVWKKTFATPSACGNIQVVTEPPAIIHFGSRPAAKPGAPAPPPRPPEEPLPRDQRRVGAAAGGGYFGLRGVYVVTSDGYIHEQIMATGLDYAPPVKFLGPQNGSSFGLNMNDKVVYTETGQGCRNQPNAVWSIDLNTPDYSVNNYKTRKSASLVYPARLSGRTVQPISLTASGTAAPPVYANSVVALTAKN